MRRLSIGASALVLAMTMATAAEAKSGVVFVHGKGGADLANASVARAYWGEDMLRTVTKGFTVPYLICSYDGTKAMWTSGNTVATQISNWANANAIDSITIETHSFGGIVMRWIFSNPTYQSNYQNVINRTRWINSVAPPNKGSEAANLAGTLSGSWLTGWLVSLVGQDNESTRNCRTSDMAYYNQYYLKGTSGRPALPKQVYSIAGTGLWNDFVHSEDYGLATLSGVAGMPGEDDGMVSQYSAQGAGVVWFLTGANHHHNRRWDYDKNIGNQMAAEF
jgi:hypothetical protein